MQFDGYIFDVEGTLVDCVPQNLKSLGETLEKWGLSVPSEVLQRYSGLDGNETLKLVAPHLSEQERMQLMKEEGANYVKVHLPTVRAFEGVQQLFSSIKAEGGSIAFATDCKGAPLNFYRSLLQVDDFIDHVACGEDAHKGKPDPELVRVAVKKLGLPPTRCAMIGDTPYDAKAATAVGVPAIGLMSGGFHRDALLKAGATTVVKRVDELRQLFLRHKVGG